MKPKDIFLDDFCTTAKRHCSKKDISSVNKHCPFQFEKVGFDEGNPFLAVSFSSKFISRTLKGSGLVLQLGGTAITERHHHSMALAQLHLLLPDNTLYFFLLPLQVDWSHIRRLVFSVKIYVSILFCFSYENKVHTSNLN
jgi:hypothetical protein